MGGISRKLRNQLIVVNTITLLLFAAGVVFVLRFDSILSENGVWTLPISFPIVGIGVLFILSWWLSVFFVRGLIHPLEELRIIVERILKGDLKARYYTKSKNEIGVLANTINGMTEQRANQIRALQQSIKMKEEFINIAAHYLRTPIFVLNGYVEQLQTNNAIPEFIQDEIQAISIQSHKLGLIGEELLAITEIQGNLVSIDHQTVDFTIFSKKIAEEQKAKAEEHELSYAIEMPDTPQYVEINTEWLTQAWNHLIENGIKFTNPGGKVIVRTGVDDKGNVFGEVEDNGIGVPKEEQDKIFLPFHRSQDVLDAAYEGIGVGLYLVKLVIEAHFGKISIDSTEGIGTKIRFTLPPAKDQHA